MEILKATVQATLSPTDKANAFAMMDTIKKMEFVSKIQTAEMVSDGTLSRVYANASPTLISTEFLELVFLVIQ
jgi:hypothetical protein